MPTWCSDVTRRHQGCPRQIDPTTENTPTHLQESFGGNTHPQDSWAELLSSTSTDQTGIEDCHQHEQHPDFLCAVPTSERRENDTILDEVNSSIPLDWSPTNHPIYRRTAAYGAENNQGFHNIPLSSPLRVAAPTPICLRSAASSFRLCVMERCVSTTKPSYAISVFADHPQTQPLCHWNIPIMSRVYQQACLTKSQTSHHNISVLNQVYRHHPMTGHKSASTTTLPHIQHTMGYQQNRRGWTMKDEVRRA